VAAHEAAEGGGIDAEVLGGLLALVLAAGERGEDVASDADRTGGPPYFFLENFVSLGGVWCNLLNLKVMASACSRIFKLS
jgi:hypothetical protein